MKISENIFSLLIAILFITACSGGSGDNDYNAEFVASRDFSLNASIDSETLTQEDNLRIHESFFELRDEAYVIRSNVDLDAFNQTLTSNEQILLSDLNVYTYYFIRGPGCPDYFEYSNHSYVNNLITITLDHFHQPDAACTAAIEEIYVVFKARKSS